MATVSLAFTLRRGHGRMSRGSAAWLRSDPCPPLTALPSLIPSHPILGSYLGHDCSVPSLSEHRVSGVRSWKESYGSGGEVEGGNE